MTVQEFTNNLIKQIEQKLRGSTPQNRTRKSDSLEAPRGHEL